MEKAKILWIGEFTNPTGLGNVSRNLIKHLNDFFEIDVCEYQLYFFEGETKDPSTGNRILGAASRDDNGSFKRLQQFDFSPYQAIFIINDVWAVNMYAHLLKMRQIQKPVIAYFPVDAEEHNPEWYQHFDYITVPITYTEFARKVVLKAAPWLKEKLTIMPHGVDTDTFYKLETPKAELRKSMWGNFMADPENAFVVFNGNRNQPRKKLDITMRAFAEFAKNKENVWLHMHCGITDQSMNIYQLAERFNISDKVIYSELVSGIQHISPQQLNMYYNAADVGVNTSMGEGWGLVNVEHAATGSLQLVPAHSACKELFGEWDCALIQAATPWLMDNVMTLGYIPDYIDLAQRLDNCYWNKRARQNIGRLQMEKFTSDKYSWKTIALCLKGTINGTIQ